VVDLKSKFTKLASDVLDASAEEAKELGHTYVGTEHLLLSILKASMSSAAGILFSHDVTYEATLEIAKEIYTQYFLNHDFIYQSLPSKASFRML